MIYQAFSTPVPANKAKKNMNTFAIELVQITNTQMGRYHEKVGHEPDTLLIPPNAPTELLTEWFRDVMFVVPMRNPDNMFGVTYRGGENPLPGE